MDRRYTCIPKGALAAGRMRLYVRYLRQKIADSYSGQFRMVLVP